MRKVLVIAPLFPPSVGGVQTIMENFAIHSHHNIHVLTERREGTQDEKYDFRVTRMDLRTVNGLFNFLWFLLKNRHSFDVVYFARPTMKPFEFISSLFLPTISHVHGTELTLGHRKLPDHFPFRRIRTFWRWIFLQLGLRRVDRFIVVSEWTKNQLLDFGVPEDDIRVIPPGVDYKHFSQGDCEKCTISPNNERTTLLTVSRLEERKGHELVIEAISTLDDFEYFIVGDGSNRDRIADCARKLGIEDRVQLLGHISNNTLPDIYDCCDIFILTSLPLGDSIESFGITYIEANAAGKPVIGSNIMGVPSAIRQGETGFLIEPTVKAIREVLLSNVEDKLSTSNCQEWAKQHDWASIVPRIDREISNL